MERTRGPHSLLGELLIHEGLITDPQLEAALQAQQAGAAGSPIGQILVEQGALSQQDLGRVLDEYNRKYRLGDILVETNVITQDQLELAVDHHRKTGLRLGDALLQLDFVSEVDLKRALCWQLGLTFVDLDRLVIDRSLASLIPKEYAQHHRVLPIARSEDTLTAVVADPTDGKLADDLQQSTGCRVHLAASTDAGFQRAFARIYGEGPAVGLARQHEQLGQAHVVLGREYESTLRALAELRTAQEAFLREHEASLAATAEERARAEAQTRALEELRTAHEALAAEHEITSHALAEERAQVDQWSRVYRDLEAAHDAARQEAIDQLRALEVSREACADLSQALAALRAEHADVRARHEALQAEHERTSRELQERQQLAAAELEAVLRRLRA